MLCLVADTGPLCPHGYRWTAAKHERLHNRGKQKKDCAALLRREGELKAAAVAAKRVKQYDDHAGAMEPASKLARTQTQALASAPLAAGVASMTPSALHLAAISAALEPKLNALEAKLKLELYAALDAKLNEVKELLLTMAGPRGGTHLALQSSLPQ